MAPAASRQARPRAALWHHDGARCAPRVFCVDVTTPSRVPVTGPGAELPAIEAAAAPRRFAPIGAELPAIEAAEPPRRASCRDACARRLFGFPRAEIARVFGNTGLARPHGLPAHEASGLRDRERAARQWRRACAACSNPNGRAAGSW